MNSSSVRIARTRLIAGLGILGCSVLGVGFGLEVGSRGLLTGSVDEGGTSYVQHAALGGRESFVLAKDVPEIDVGDQRQRDGGLDNASVKVDGEGLGVPSSEPASLEPDKSQAAATDVDGSENEDELYKELEVFTSVIAIVQRDYVQKVPGKKLVEGAIRGMLSALDPHSGYLDADFFQDLQSQTKGEFGGLGVEITVRDGSLVVVAPMEGSPAEKAGLKAGDQIVKIGAESTKQFSIVDAVKRLRGPRGSEVRLSVLRQGFAEPLELAIVRDNIALKSVRSRYLGDGYGYVRVTQFAEKTTEDLKKALESFRNQSEGEKIKGLVLDLRNNPGGLLSQAVAVGDLFLDDGIIVYTDGRVEGQKQKFYAHPRGTEPKYPMIVMVNGGSASASEIVAGSLKEAGRALVLGSQTFGKGSVQTITPLDNGGAVTLTTALYYTRSGRSLQALGVAPDIAIDAAGVVVKSNGEEKSEGGAKSGAAAEGGVHGNGDGSGAQQGDQDSSPSGAGNPLIDEANQEDLIREGDLPGAIRNPDLGQQEAGGLGKGVDSVSAPSGQGDMKKLPLVGSKSAAKEASINYEKDELSNILTRDPQLDKAYGILRSYGEFS